MDARGIKPQLFDPGPNVPLTVTSISVKNLHGKFSYELDVAPSGGRPSAAATGELVAINEERLTLLYGNNGSGKTSMLRLLFHALSSANDRGHRTTLLRTRFERLDIYLSDGTHISYSRKPGEFEGPYDAALERPKSKDPAILWHYVPNGQRHQMLVGGQWKLVVDAEGRYVAGDESDPATTFLDALAGTGLNPVFLGDSRAITADMLDSDDVGVRDAIRTGRRAMELEEIVRQTRDLDIENALQLVRQYLSQLAFAGTQAGSQRVDTVYLNVSRLIIQHASNVGRPSKGLIPSLAERVEQLGVRAQRFHEYGLLPEFPVAPLLEVIVSAQNKNGPLLQHVLAPYLDGMDERMDALEAGLQTVASFIDALNSFLEGKRAEFRLSGGGVWILDEATGERLDASELSSGEKQIVLLFSDIIALQEQTRLFIIDEPELSLNPQWQRMLMPSLLRVTEQSSMQLIAATHSIEIMARYRARIRRLET
jgi:energy-coupling factor transporter ATP-binding protein EcfA2